MSARLATNRVWPQMVWKTASYISIYNISIYISGRVYIPRAAPHRGRIGREGCAQRLKPSSPSNATEKRNAMLRRTHLGKLVMISKSPPFVLSRVEGSTAVFQHPLDASEFKPSCSLFFH